MVQNTTTNTTAAKCAVATINSLPANKKAVLIKFLRDTLNGLAATMDFANEVERTAYPHWVESQRRGLDRFFVHNEKGKFALNEQKHPIIINSDEVIALFRAYINKAMKNGIDPCSAAKPGRKCKVKVIVETADGTITAETDTTSVEVEDAVADTIEAAMEQTAEVLAESVE